ncbi:unnamed protein product [Heligmosomoides polygyrus]|uniref:Uncharacterized protein n=1 Tax=Heligmosomoides polygyrus TaxID=6339 RepID=A0A183F8U8_HELPZ|nr:unnamed protein product [Heligmosomoides polygyrus]
MMTMMRNLCSDHDWIHRTDVSALIPGGATTTTTPSTAAGAVGNHHRSAEAVAAGLAAKLARDDRGTHPLRLCQLLNGSTALTCQSTRLTTSIDCMAPRRRTWQQHVGRKSRHMK